MKKLITIAVLVILTALLRVPSAVGAQGDRKGRHVILHADGPTDTLADHIKSLGGKVTFRYRNVRAVAATIPADRMDAVARFPGVTHVEKDRMIRLHDGPGDGEYAVFPGSFVVDGLEGVEIRKVDTNRIDPEALPEGYAGYLTTGAVEVWDETGGGAGTIVAVVDTGVVPNLCIDHAVIGAPGFPDGYNATGDGISATDAGNHYHGTFMGGVIASACALILPTNDPLYQAFSAYLPCDSVTCEPGVIPIFGQAPEAKLYPVKVFDINGGESPNSVILAGLDHILTLKKSGVLDIDIVNMSLGGPTVYDGRDAFDRFVLELWKADILVVASAGNAGPIPNTVGSPATAFNSIAAGGLDYAVSSRIFYEFLGLSLGADGVPGSGDEAPGMGLVQRPTEETRVSNFSSRGPLSDGRAGPDISALGAWSFHAGPDNSLSWELGTSISSATVAGGAALLNAYWENVEGQETNPLLLRRVLVGGADRSEVGAAWQGINVQGRGALDVPASLALLKDGNRHFRPIKDTGRLRPNILRRHGKNRVQTFESDPLTLGPSETADFVFRIDRTTSHVTVEIFDISAPDNAAHAFWPNALEINIQSAKRTEAERPVASRVWVPQFFGDSVTYRIGDGLWTENEFPIANQPMEPGLCKVSLAGAFPNESPVSFKIRITRERFRRPLKRPIARGIIRMDEAFWIPVAIPEGVTTATFDLTWIRNWARFPTSDVDMLIYDPDFTLFSLDGATLNAPERAVIDSPIPGWWWVLVSGSEIYRPDLFKLHLTTRKKK